MHYIPNVNGAIEKKKEEKILKKRSVLGVQKAMRPEIAFIKNSFRNHWKKIKLCKFKTIFTMKFDSFYGWHPKTVKEEEICNNYVMLFNI